MTRDLTERVLTPSDKYSIELLIFMQKYLPYLSLKEMVTITKATIKRALKAKKRQLALDSREYANSKELIDSAALGVAEFEISHPY